MVTVILLGFMSTFRGSLPVAQAAGTLTVTRFDDPAPDGCNAEDCSLREAVIAANAVNNADVIILNAGTYTLTQADPVCCEEDASATGDLDIRNPLTIQGQGQNVTRIRQLAPAQVVEVDPAQSATFSSAIKFLTIEGSPTTGIQNHGNLTIAWATVSGNFGGGVANTGSLTLNSSTVTGNRSIYDGAGIWNYGILTANASIISYNQAQVNGGGILNYGTTTLNATKMQGNMADGNGGGIFNGGTLTLNNSMIMDSFARFNGGGVYGHAEIIGSTFSNNQAEIGGGIYTLSNGGVITTITNSTFTGNRAIIAGGAINGKGHTYLYNATITQNAATSTSGGQGGGIGVESAAIVYLENSILYGNLAPYSNPQNATCSGTLVSGGYNIIPAVSNPCYVVGNLTGNLTHDPQLGSLINVPGPWQTWAHAPMTGSSAIDAGNPAGCTDHNGFTIIADQHGHIRPSDGDGDGTARCDIGAIEK